MKYGDSTALGSSSVLEKIGHQALLLYSYRQKPPKKVKQAKR